MLEDTTSAPDLFEGMTAISAVLDPSIAAHNDRRVITVLVDKTRTDKKSRELGFLRHRAEELGFEIQAVHPDDLDNLTSGKTHGGIVAVCSDRTIPRLADSMDTIREDGFYVFLEGIEDPYNFGYSLRSLYAAGVTGVVLPPRNWMNAAGVVARASAGCSELFPLYTADAEEAVNLFRQRGYQVLCAGIRDSVSVFDESFPYPILLVIGGEKRGISRKILEMADQIVRIDYGRSFRGSLSAASAATVMAFEIFRQNKSKKE